MADFIELKGKRLAVPEDEFFEWNGATACYFRVDWAQPDSCDDPTEWRILHDDFSKDAHDKALIKLAASRAVVCWERKAKEYSDEHLCGDPFESSWNATGGFEHWSQLMKYAEEWRALT